EVTRATVAEPSASRLDIHVLCDHELGLRAADEVAVIQRVAGYHFRLEQPPARLIQQRQVGNLRVVYVKRELKVLAGQPGKLDEFPELVHTQSEPRAAVFDRSKRPTPAADAGERPTLPV